MKKAISLLLVLLSISLILTSCKPSSETSSTSSAAQTSGTESDASAAESGTTYKAEIPDVKYEGKTFKILTTAFSLSKINYSEFGFSANEEIEQNTINDAVAKRNAAVEEQLGIKIVEECVEETERFNGGKLNTRVINASQSGSDDFYICAPSLYNCAVLAEGNYLYDLMSFENLHQLSAPWWDKYFVDDISIDGRLFFVTGDIGFISRESATVCYFNKNMFQSFNLEDPYTLVNEKKWTFDQLIEWSKLVSKDLDNNGTIDYKDQYGVGGQNDCMWAMFYGSGERLAAKDQDNMPTITLYSEQSNKVVEKILDLMTDKKYFVNANDYWSVSSTPCDLLIDAFISERSLFYIESMGSVEKLRNMSADTDFGILPIPLYDENQENYQHMINPWGGNGFAIPQYLSTEDAEMASIVMEALGAASKNILVPAYYDVALKNQKTRDNESQAMLDIIFSTFGCDMGHIYNWGGMGSLIQKLAEKNLRGQFTSEFEKIKDKTQAEIDETVALFKAIP